MARPVPPELIVGTNSYCSLAEAEAFHSASPFGAGWAAERVTDDERTRALLAATRLLDETIVWAGTPARTSQARQWPRRGLLTARGASLSSTEVPTEICDAASAWALALVAAAASGSVAALGGRGTDDVISKIKAGSVELVFADAASATSAITSPSDVVPAEVLRLIPEAWRVVATSGAPAVQTVALAS